MTDSGDAIINEPKGGPDDSKNTNRIPGTNTAGDAPIVKVSDGTASEGQGSEDQKAGKGVEGTDQDSDIDEENPLQSKGDYYILRRTGHAPIFAVVTSQDDKYYYTATGGRELKKGKRPVKVPFEYWRKAKEKSRKASARSKKAWETKTKDKREITEAQLDAMPHLKLMDGVTFNVGDQLNFESIVIKMHGTKKRNLINVTKDHKGEDWDTIHNRAGNMGLAAVIAANDQNDSTPIIDAAHKEWAYFWDTETAKSADEIEPGKPMTEAEYEQMEKDEAEWKAQLAADLAAEIEDAGEIITNTESDEYNEELQQVDQNIDEALEEAMTFFDNASDATLNENGELVDKNGNILFKTTEQKPQGTTDHLSDKMAEDALLGMVKNYIETVEHAEGQMTVTFKNGRTLTLNQITGEFKVRDHQGNMRSMRGKTDTNTVNGKLSVVIDLVRGLNGGNRTLYHEAFHACWRLFLTPSEISLITRYYSKKVKTNDIVSIEEAAANAADNYLGNRNDVPPGLRTMFRRFWDRVRHFLVSIGFATKKQKIEDIFRRMEQGQLKGEGIQEKGDTTRHAYIGESIAEVDKKQNMWLMNKILRGRDPRTRGYILIPNVPNYGDVHVPVGRDRIDEKGTHIGLGLVHIREKHPGITAEMIYETLEKGESKKVKDVTNFRHNIDGKTIRVGVTNDWDGIAGYHVLTTAMIEGEEAPGGTNTSPGNSKGNVGYAFNSPSEPLPASIIPKTDPKSRYKLQTDSSKAQYDAVRKQYEGTDKWMKAPNGKPTKLNERQWLQVRTQLFKDWFGDWENDPKNASKVVDENGEPLVVYHGTDNELSVFDSGKAKIKRTSAPTGAAHFTSNPDTAAKFGDNTYPVFLNIKSPYVYDYEKEGFNDPTSQKKWIDVWGEAMANTRQYPLQAITGDKGFYDGVILTNVGDNLLSNHYVVRDEQYKSRDNYNYDFVKTRWDKPMMDFMFNTQIKSATANVGTFDPNNPDIRYKLVDEAVNRKFNEEIGKYYEGKIVGHHTFSLGNSGIILTTAGIPDLEIILHKGTLRDKVDYHKLSKDHLINLPESINDPIFVAESKSRVDSMVILTEIEHPNGNVMVTIEVGKKHGKIDINNITSIYGKEAENILAWFKDDAEQFTFVNKEKCLDYLSRVKGSHSPMLGSITKAIDKINESVGLSSPKFESVRKELQIGEYAEGDNQRYKFLDEDIEARLKAAHEMLKRNQRDPVKIAAEVAEEKGLDEAQVKEKLGRQIKSAYRESAQDVSDLMAAADIAGFDEWVDKNKPEGTDKTDLVWHFDEMIESAAEVGLSQDDVINLAKMTRFDPVRMGINIMNRMNYTGALVLSTAEAINKATDIKEREQLEKQYSILLGEFDVFRQAYRQQGSIAGTVLVSRKIQKQGMLDNLTKVSLAIEEDAKQNMQELVKLKAQLAELENVIDDYTNDIAQLESAFNKLIAELKKSGDKRFKSLPGKSIQDDINKVSEQIEQKKAMLEEAHRAKEGLLFNIMEVTKRIEASNERSEKVKIIIDREGKKPTKPKTPRIIPLQKPGLTDYVKAIWYNGILSGLITHTVNMTANMVHGLQEVLAGMVVHPVATLRGVGMGARAVPGAIKAGLKTLKNPEEEHKQKWEMNNFQNKVMKYINFNMRLMSAEDQFFYHINHQRNLMSLAVLESKRLRKEGTKATVQSLFNNPTLNMIQQAVYRAKYDTFNNTPEGVMGFVAQAVNDAYRTLETKGAAPGKAIALALRFNVMPFTMVVGNVANAWLRWTPAGLVSVAELMSKNPDSLWNIQKGWKDENGKRIVSPYRMEDIKLQLARSIIGTILMSALMALAMGGGDDDDDDLDSQMGFISGNGPDDLELQRQLKLLGWLPCSYRVGDRWIPYKEYAIGGALNVVGNVHDYYKWNKKANKVDLLNISTYVSLGLAKSFMDKSFLSGLKSVTMAIGQKNEKYAKRQITSMNPLMWWNFANFFSRTLDGKYYDPATLSQQLVASIPFAPKDGIPTRVNVFGNDQQGDSPMVRILGQGTREKSLTVIDKRGTPHSMEAVLAKVTAQGINLPAIGAGSYTVAISGNKKTGELIDLTGWDKNAFQRLRGYEMSLMLISQEDKIDRLLIAGNIDDLNDLISKIGRSATEQVQKQMLRAYRAGELQEKYIPYTKSKDKEQ